jgi:hypothetical protein
MFRIVCDCGGGRYYLLSQAAPYRRWPGSVEFWSYRFDWELFPTVEAATVAVERIRSSGVIYLEGPAAGLYHERGDGDFERCVLFVEPESAPLALCPVEGGPSRPHRSGWGSEVA